MESHSNQIKIQIHLNQIKIQKLNYIMIIY